MEPSLSPISSQTDSPFRGAGRLLFLGFFSALGYGGMALLSGDSLRPQSPDPLAILRFLQIYGFLFVGYLILIAPLVKGRRMDPRHLWFAIAFALLFRALLLPTDAILNDHLYRAMWDGHISREKINPYRHSPQSEELLSVRTDYWPNIPDRDRFSLDLPSLQYVYLVSESLYPGNGIGMKFILLIFDVGTIFLLMAALEWIKKPPEWCLIYAWSPLVIKEIANSGNAAAVSAFGVALTMLFVVKGKQGGCGLTLAALVGSRLGSVLFLPLFHQAWRGRHYIAFVAGLFLLCLPFVSLDVNPLAGWFTALSEKHFNGGIYSLVEFGLTHLNAKAAENSSTLARLFLLAVVLIVTLWQTLLLVWRREPVDVLRALFVVSGTLLLCSPTIEPGSLIWLIPFLCLFPSRAWILLTGLVVLSYLFYEHRLLPVWVMGIEFGLFFYVGIIECLIAQNRWGVMRNTIRENDPAPDSSSQNDNP